MTYVVTQPCFGCTYMDCAEVCPVEAFHVNEEMLYINPGTCIDCDACVPECPVGAIFPDHQVPEMWKEFIELNAEMAPQLPVWDGRWLRKDRVKVRSSPALHRRW